MPYAGLDISDDAIHSLCFGSRFGRTRIKSYGSLELPDGLVRGGDVTDQTKLVERLSVLAKKENLTYVKVGISEEKAYLFQVDVPLLNFNSIRQNIESRLEENVPLAAPDALFYFDLLPALSSGGSLRASVSVVPRTYIEHLTAILRSAGLKPVAFEVVPKALAHVVVASQSTETIMIAHLMNHKTGIYIISGGAVCFTSTLNNTGVLGVADDSESKLSAADILVQEIIRINEYWVSRSGSTSIARVVLVGRDAHLREKELGGTIVGPSIPVVVPNIWDALSNPGYVPPIKKADSFAYAVTAGLAFPS